MDQRSSIPQVGLPRLSLQLLPVVEGSMSRRVVHINHHHHRRPRHVVRHVHHQPSVGSTLLAGLGVVTLIGLISLASEGASKREKEGGTA